MSLARVGSLAALLLASAALVGLGQGPQSPPIRRPPPFAGAAIPDPPEQGPPWTPPATKLPRFLLRATPFLFERGVADPRGSEYREVDLGDALLLTTHAFVLPERAGAAGRFAVGWDGVVYPVSRVGEAADLDADIRTLAGALQGRTAQGADAAAARRGAGFAGLAMPMFRPVGQKPTGPASVETASAIKVVLLLRLGRADLAEALFSAGTDWTPDRPAPDLTNYHVSSLTLAQEWADRVFKRAVDAHARGDDAVALDAARRVAAFVAATGPELAAMGFAPPSNGPRTAGSPPFFPQLGQLPELLADQERRAREPRRGPIPGPDAPAAARVAALIRDLDQVAGGTGLMMNGMTAPTGSDMERALVAEGEAAVEPLLAALEADDRLTRTVSYPGSRHGQDDRLVHRVVQAEQSALIGILRTRVIPGMTNLGWNDSRAARRDTAAAIRAYWEKNRGVPELERYYRTLLDDGATVEQWLDAAEALAQPADVRGRGGSYIIPHRVGDKVPPARGEPLRGRADPGVTALIARRAEAIDPAASRAVPSQGSGKIFEVGRANRMATFLAQWDAPGAAPTLKARVARCAALLQASSRDAQENGLATDIARMTTLRLASGDPSALDDYAAWVRTVAPDVFGLARVEMFEPIWRHAEHPAIAEAARFLFGDPASPWVPLVRPGERGWQDGGSRAEAITSPLLGFESFRALVLAGLADMRASGSVDVDANGKIAVHIGTEMTQFPAPGEGDPLRPPPSSTTPLRVADLYASTLATIAGFPPAERYWPIARRDEAIAACAATLRRYGPRLGFGERSRPLLEAAPFYPQHPRAVFAFEPLDRAATAEDVEAGRAIFHVEGAEARPWPLPSLPLPARWATLAIPDDDPGLRGFDPKQGRPRAQIEMLQGGHVWQAEEARAGDRWQRSYGLVWRHGLARVPAEAIEFPAPWPSDWARVGSALDGRLVAPGGTDNGTRIIIAPVPLGGPLVAEAWLRNRRGVDAEAPGSWSRDEGGLALREGVSIRLYRRPDPPARALGQPPDAPPPPVEIPARAVARRHRDAPTLTLAPTATARVLRLDLRDLFLIDAPGRYRLEVALDGLAPEDEQQGRGVLAAEFIVGGGP